MERFPEPRPAPGGGCWRTSWWRTLALLLLLLGGALRSHGQATIARAEYFIDADPGFGAATAFTLPATPAADLAGLSATVPLSALSTGFHVLGVRSQDSNGQWSLTNRRSFYYEPALTGALANINKVEYFIDTDPGLGAATDVPVTAAADISGVAFTVPLASLSSGFHTLGTRSRDANGTWSLTNRRTFYYEPALTGTLANINKVEYFIDAEPGFGNGTDVPVTAGTDISGVAFTVPLATLSSGFHTLSVRSRDANGKWSLTNMRTFYYEPALTGALANINKVEYFIDTEPGLGNGTDVPVTAATDISGVAFTVPLAALSSGFHTLSVRSRDANGKWSLTNVRTFYYEPVLTGALANINKVEYFIDTEPGFGNGTDVPVTAAADISGLAFAVPLASLSTGFHTLQVRSRDANGKWSLTNVRSFYYEPNLAAAPNINKIEFYFDNDPGFGLATDVPVPTPAPDLANFSFTADASGLADGAHRIFFRSRDANGKWSLVSSRSFVKNGCASSANLTAGLPSSSYNYGGSVGGPVEAAFNAEPATPTTSNSPYVYNGAAIQADMGSAQTISEVRVKFTNSATPTNFTLQIQTATSTAGPFNTVDTYTATFNANGVYPVVRTLATPATNARVLRLVFQSTGGNYTIVSGVGAYFFNCASPSITSFTPTGGGAGTVVTLVGTNLSGASAVTFNGVPALVSTIGNNTNTGLTVTAPVGGTTGPICVTTPNGTACSSGSFAYPPSIATGAVSSSAFCSSTFIQVPFTTNMADYGSGNVFRFQLSDASGVFTAGSRLYGTLISQNASGGILRDTIAFRTPAGSGYRVRVVASNPAITGTDNGTNLTVYPTPGALASSNSPVAYNGTIQLVATPTGQSSYQWYVNYTSGGTAYVGAGQTLNLPNAQPTQSGKYYVYVTNSSGCQDSASVRVLVQPNAVPVLTMSQFNFTGCAGATLNIGFSVTGNNFANGNTISVQLSDASGSFAAPTVIGSAAFTGQGNGAISATIPTNTPTGTGYRIRMVGSNPAVTSNDNGSNIGITTQPTATPGSNSPVAYNGTIQLTAQTVAGASYQWFGPGFSSSQQNPTIPNATPSNSGTYTLYVTVNGCQSPGAPIAVTVNPSAQPILAIGQFGGTLCQGVAFNVGFSVVGNNFAAGNTITAQLSDASGSFAAPTAIGSVSFSGQGNGAISATIPTSTPTGTGYRIRLVGSNPAVTSTSDNGSNLTVPTLLVATASSNSPVTAGGTLQLFAGPSGATSYQWYANTGSGNVFISSQQNPSFNNITTASSGQYTVIVTQGSCQSTATTPVTINPPSATTLAISQFGGFTTCAGNAANVGFTVTGAALPAGTTITAQLSDASGSFAAPATIGSLTFSGTGSNTILGTYPSNTPTGTGYRVRLIASASVNVSPADNGSNISINPPLVAAVTANNSPVAAGGTIQLNAQVVSGASYVWFLGKTQVGTGPSLTIPNATSANAGTYDLFVSLGSCQSQTSAVVVVTAPGTSLATTAFSGSFCPGSTLTVAYTASGFASGNTFTAQLSNASGSFAAPVAIGSTSGTGSGSIAATIPAGTAAGTAYRIRVVADNPATIGSDNGSNLTVGALTYVWTGGVSTDWFNGANWSCGQVPTASSVVTIPAGASFYPVITGSVTALALHLTIASGATFTNNGTFYLYGNVTNNGTSLASNASFWYFLGGGTQYVYGTNQFQTGTVVISSATTLTLNNLLYVNGNWNNSGVFVGGSSYAVYFNGTGNQFINGPAVTTFSNVFVNSGAVLNLGINTIFLGNLTTTGTFNAGTYGVAFNGGTAQTIGGTGTSTYYTVTINNTVGVTLLSNITVLGNWINNGQFASGTYSVIFAGTAAQLIGGTQITYFYGVNFQNPVSVTLTQNIYVLGSFVNSGIFYGYQTVGSTTTGYYVRFGGNTAQVITANATTYFYHFYVDNVAGVSLSTNIYIAGNYYLYSGTFNPGTYTVYFNGFEGPTVVQTVGGVSALTFHTWGIATGAYVRLLQNVTLLGSFGNLGTFYGYNLVGSTYTGYTLTFGGSSAQSLTGTGVFEFWHVVWNNLAGITLNQNISVWGNWLNNGGFLANGYLVNFIGNVAQTIGGSVLTIFHHVTITNTVSVSLLQAITVLGNWAGSGVFLGNGYLVYFNGTAAQTIFCGLNTRFFDLRFSNPTSITLLSNIYLLGSWTHDGGFVANGYTVFFNGTGATQLIGGTVTSLFHHLTISPSAQVQLGRVVTILGSWTNNGIFGHGNYTVTFAGSGAQLISGSTSTIFYGITFANTGTVTLGQDIRVRGLWTNNGEFAPATYIVYFDGSIAQTIAGSAATTFFGLNILNTVGGVSISGPIFIKGNLVNNGLFACSGYLVTFNGTTLQTIGGTSTTIFGDITTNNVVGVALGQDIRVRGDFRNLALFTAGGFSVYFDGSLAQSIYSTGTLTFHHVVFANTLGVTLQNNIFLTGNWTNNGGFVANGKLVTFSGTVLQLIAGTVPTVFHHFTIATGATVQQNLGIALLGDWTNNGTFLHNSLLVYFNGTVLQTIAGTALTTFYDVTFNNPVNVSLGQHIDVVHNFINSGGFCGCGFRTRFNGTVPQSITCTSGRTHFHDITFANLAGITLLNGIYVSGLWVNNGGFLANNQVVIFDGTALQTIGGTVLTAFYHWQNTNVSTAGVTLLRDVSYAGNWTNNGQYCGCGFLSLFNGSAAQALTCTTGHSNFHHLTLANTSAGGVTLTGDINVSGNWLVSSIWNPQTYTVFFNGTSGQSIGVGGSITQALFHHLTISNTAAAGVTLGCPLSLTGNWTNNGVFFAGLNTVFANGTVLQSFGGTAPTTFYNWVIANPAGASCTGTGGTASVPGLGIQHVLTMAAGGGNLACGGNLTLLSNASGTAMVVNQPGGGVCTGLATMERFITGLSGAPGYRHYSSPMKLSAGAIRTTVQEFADDLPVFELNPAYNTVGNSATPFPTLFKFDETRITTTKPTFDDGWMVPTASEDLVPLRGYTAQTLPTTTVDISGQLQNGNVSYSITRGSLANSGWALLGNPYPAPMDWDVVRSTTGMLNGVADALYVFQPSGQYTGTYQTYVNGLGTNGGNKDLAAMQGFLVRATAPTASVSFTNAVRATSYLSPVFNRQTPTPAGPVTTTVRPLLRLEARNVANATADEALIYFEPGAGLGFSARHDSYKVQLNGSGRPSLWSIAGTEGFAINGLPDLATAPVIPLGVRVSVDGKHELALTGLTDVPAGTQVWLEDRVLNRRQNLAANPIYDFSMLANYTGQRFYLNFVAGTVTAVTTGKLEARTALYPNPTSGKATLELAGLREQGAVKVEVVNVLGQTVRTLSVRPKLGFLTETLDLSGLPSGVYTVRIYAQEGTVVKRLVKE